MTNLEWIRSPSVEELSDIIFGSRCNMCAYQKREDCPTDEDGRYDCNGGFAKWARQERKPPYRVNWCVARVGKFYIKANSKEEAIQTVRKEKLSEILDVIKGDISLSIGKEGETK